MSLNKVHKLYHQALNISYRELNAIAIDINSLQVHIVHDIIVKCNDDAVSGYKNCISIMEQLKFDNLIRLLKFQRCKKNIMKFIQKLISNGYPIGNHIITKFFDEDKLDIRKYIENGLYLGEFLCECSWYDESEKILRNVRDICCDLPASKQSDLIRLKSLQKLYKTLTMRLTFVQAKEIFNEISVLLIKIESSDVTVREFDFPLIYADFSRFALYTNNYTEAHNWIKKAICDLSEQHPISTQVLVLQQACRVSVKRRKMTTAKCVIYQALIRAELHYGPDSYEMGRILIDLAHFLLNNDQISDSVDVYKKAYELHREAFGTDSNNLQIALAEEDMAYALYAKEYTNRKFDEALTHAQNALMNIKKLVPAKTIMLASVYRVNALILEEIALVEDNEKQLLQAESLYKEALELTLATFGEENLQTARQYGNLGRVYQSMKKFELAEEMQLKAISIKENISGPHDYEVALSLGHLASLYNFHMERYKLAEQYYLRSMKIYLELFSPAYTSLQYDYYGLIHVYNQLGDGDSLEKYLLLFSEWDLLQEIRIFDVVKCDFHQHVEKESVANIIDKFINGI